MKFIDRLVKLPDKKFRSNRFKKSVIKVLFFSLISLPLLTSCQSIPNKPWTSLLPNYAPAVLVPASNVTVGQVLKSVYMPFFEDLTSSTIPMIKKIEKIPAQSLKIKAMVVFPSTSMEWQPVWITDAPKGFVAKLDTFFRKNLTSNHYHFDHIEIYKFHVGDRLMFAAQLKNWGLFSESSLGIEASIRAYLGKRPSLNISSPKIKHASLILNSGHLDQWVDQQCAVRFRPYILNSFIGLKPADLKVGFYGNPNEKNIRIHGIIPIGQKHQSELTKALSSMNGPITLDRYIPTDAAAFAIFHEPVQDWLPDSLKPTTKIDSVLALNPDLVHSLSKNAGSEFAFVTFDPSGYFSIGENLYIRKLRNVAAFTQKMDTLAAHGLIKKEVGGYFVDSPIMAKLIGSPLCTYDTFYLGFAGNSVVLSPRLGLTDRVQTDLSQNRVFFYSNDFKKIKNDIPTKPSAIFFAKSKHLYRYLKSYLGPSNYVSAITSKFDLLSASLSLNNNKTDMVFNLKTYKSKNTNLPFREKWVFPLDGGQLTGKPVLANIGGTSRNEILLATSKGYVYALASDGTILTQTSTGSNVPVGSPVVYDWYGNNQSVIMIAAGNKIYAWNSNGDPLPKFPIKLKNQITSPITIADVTRDGLPDIIVATANQKLHVINGRGFDITGWPVSTNSNVTFKPVFHQFNGQWSVWADAENGLFAWNKNGKTRKGFPIFTDASFSTRPAFDNNVSFIGSADGHLYTLSKNRILNDSLNVFRHTSYDSLGHGLHLGALYVSNAALTGTPSFHDVNIRIDSTTTKKEHVVLVQSSNGAEFMYNLDGKLQFTENMGQPSAENDAPFISDLRDANSPDLVAVASYGRLYAWDILSGERLYQLPTTAMSYPIVTDLDGDGTKDLIAETQDGLVCWTLTKKQDMVNSSNSGKTTHSTQQ